MIDVRKAIAAFSLCAFAFSAMASDDMQYPTVWQIINKSDTAVSLSCFGASSGLLNGISDLQSLKIASGGRVNYTWSPYWYNDGLGLNASYWSCRDDRSGTTFGGFSTGWGERVVLEVSKVGSQLTLDKKS